jgi:hypothetical protein
VSLRGDGAVSRLRLLDEDLLDAKPNLEFFLADLAGAMSHWREKSDTVLVDCVKAERRTPALCAVYLAHDLGISGEEALTEFGKD